MKTFDEFDETKGFDVEDWIFAEDEKHVLPDWLHFVSPDALQTASIALAVKRYREIHKKYAHSFYF